MPKWIKFKYNSNNNKLLAIRKMHLQPLSAWAAGEATAPLLLAGRIREFARLLFNLFKYHANSCQEGVLLVAIIMAAYF